MRIVLTLPLPGRGLYSKAPRIYYLEEMGIEMNAGFVGLKCSEVVDLVTLWVKSCGLASDLINIILIAGLRQCILSSQQLTYK